jgi:hypothetical protein
MGNDDCQAILRDCPRALPAKLEFGGAWMWAGGYKTGVSQLRYPPFAWYLLLPVVCGLGKFQTRLQVNSNQAYFISFNNLTYASASSSAVPLT